MVIIRTRLKEEEDKESKSKMAIGGGGWFESGSVRLSVGKQESSSKSAKQNKVLVNGKVALK